MTAVKQDERIRGIDIGGKTQPAATGDSQFDIGKLPALVNFIAHILLSFSEAGSIILVVIQEEHTDIVMTRPYYRNTRYCTPAFSQALLIRYSKRPSLPSVS